MTMTASEDYAARLARVQANKGRSVIMVGRDDSFVHERAQIVQISRVATQAAGFRKAA